MVDEPPAIVHNRSGWAMNVHALLERGRAMAALSRALLRAHIAGHRPARDPGLEPTSSSDLE
jgi:hypothetical protein